VNPVKADSANDVNDLIELIRSSGTKVVKSKECDGKYLGYYQSPTKDGKGDVLVICSNNIDMKDMSALWETVAHESTHVMQACHGGMLWKSEYHPRMLRNLKEQSPHYAEILNEYRGAEKMSELEAFDMELKSSSEVKQLFQEFCLSANAGPKPEVKPDTTSVYAIAGGRDAYLVLLTWASNNLSKSELKQLAADLDSNDPQRMTAAISKLQQQYQSQQRFEEYRLF